MKRLIIFLALFICLPLMGEVEIGLALSGGGARGFAHIGVLKVIDKMNIKIDYISGTSTGAIIGGLYAMGYSGLEIEEIFLTSNWREVLTDRVDREHVYVGQKRWKPYANFLFPLNETFTPRLPKGFLSGNTLINTLFDLTYPATTVQDFSQLEIPFSCTATDVLTGDLKVFSTGSLHEAIRASISFPSFLEPFEIDNRSYFDGGINANFPVEIVADMGADFIIGVKVTTGLKDQDELIDLIDILDQTVNFKISENVERSSDQCNLIIIPELAEYSNTSFNNDIEIIAKGEKAARTMLQNVDFPTRKAEDRKGVIEPVPVVFSRITVQGNSNLSSSKIKLYLGLEKGVQYTRKEISEAFNQAYNSELFDYIYPKIRENEKGSQLLITVKERNRKKLGINYTYNDQNEFTAGFILELNNYLQRNSKLLVSLKLGNVTELDLDYVKNFGNVMGVYFRLFPYFRENRVFSYNEDHEKVNSVKSRQVGATFGVGLFLHNAFNAELYSYSYDTEMYRDIADFEKNEYRSSGVGFKFYHEGLDDFVFPMQGAQLLAKISSAHKDYLSDVSYNKFYTRMKFLLPFSRNFSFKYQFEYGSYFESDDIEFDPFLIGGYDSFLGLNENEMSAPIYRVNTLSFRLRLLKDLYSDLQYNILTLGNSDVWLPEDNIYHGAGIKLGYNAFWGPIRFAAAIDKDLKAYYYFSFGYEWDFFEFSRH